jgi:hypothetical protein
MTSFEGLHNLRQLLDRHDVPLTNWKELSQPGFSGARIYKQSNPGGLSYVVKVTSLQTDWIMRATSDRSCREAVLANTAGVRDGHVGSPAIESARDGSLYSILMHDVSAHLLPNDRLTNDQLTAILLAMSRLHSRTPPSDFDVPWCSIEDRLTLFEPDPDKLANFRIGSDILSGWELFFEYVPKDIGDLVRSLFDDIGPLIRALGQLPDSFLHGDLKLDNIGLHLGGSLSLIDWSMPMIAPAAVELGWFLAMNSRALPRTLDETMVAYTAYSNIESSVQERHQAMTILCGLLIRGWRKALDAASGEPAELRWWCEHASIASRML